MSERNLPGDAVLDIIIFYPDLVKTIENEAAKLARTVRLDWNRHEDVMFGAHVLPEIGASLLPGEIWTESDVATWCDHVLFKPALAGMRALGNTSSQDPRPNHTHRDLFNKGSKFPYVSSAKATKTVNPDRLFVLAKVSPSQDRKQNDTPKQASGCTVEIKSQHVFHEEFLRDLTELPDTGEGKHHAMKFMWPEQGTSSEPVKVIVQVTPFYQHHKAAHWIPYYPVRFGLKCTMHPPLSVCSPVERGQHSWPKRINAFTCLAFTNLRA